MVLPPDLQFTADPPELVEMAEVAERRSGLAQRAWLHDGVKAQRCHQSILVLIAKLVAGQGFKRLDRNAGRQSDVVEIATLRHPHRCVIARVKHFPGKMGAIIPDPGSTGDRADIRSNHRIKPAAEPGFRNAERVPARLCHPPAVAHLIEMEAVVLGSDLSHGCFAVLRTLDNAGARCFPKPRR